jgi:hypothetical protein
MLYILLIIIYLLNYFGISFIDINHIFSCKNKEIAKFDNIVKEISTNYMCTVKCPCKTNSKSYP